MPISVTDFLNDPRIMQWLQIQYMWYICNPEHVCLLKPNENARSQCTKNPSCEEIISISGKTDSILS